jgi:hypothetical protein
VRHIQDVYADLLAEHKKLRRLKWTREVPTVAGMYLIRDIGTSDNSLVTLVEYAEYMHVEELDCYAGDLDQDVEWAGPIAEPEDE